MKPTLCLFTIICAFASFGVTSESLKFEPGSEAHIRSVTGAIDDELLINAEEELRDWLTYGRDYREQRHSPLTQINTTNLERLDLAWSLELGTKRGIQGTPIVVDGIMYLTGPWSVVYAINVRKGQFLWKYDPGVDRTQAIKFCCGVVNRGPAIYKGRVFVATLDGRVVALDAATGELIWSKETFSTDGTFYSITGAVRIFDGKVVIGNGGAEFRARGFVSAYGAADGDLVWRFYTVPGDPGKPFEHPDLAAVAKTWNGRWWEQGGGGTAWDSIVYDPELGLVFIGVGNGSHWDQSIRSPDGGDNLYLSSIVAVSVKTGEYVWHYQTTPGDTWDYTATQPITLADIEIDGEPRKVLFQAPKNGFFYVLDRETGELISAEPYTYVNWASHIGDDGRPVEIPGSRYLDGKAHWITPGSHGAHNWQPQAYNPNTGFVYIPGVIKPGLYYSNGKYGYGSKEGPGVENGFNVSMSTKLYVETVFDDSPKAPAAGQATGRLIAFDPKAMEEAWGVDMPLHYNGGLLSTESDLLFQLEAEGFFVIRDAINGQKLWQFDVRAGGIAPPITYLVDGEQYVTAVVGWGGGQGQTAKVFDTLHPGTIYTFKLDGQAAPPPKLSQEPKGITAYRRAESPEVIGRGASVFLENCAGCHALPSTGGGALPDLARSHPATLKSLEAIVLQGAYVGLGMPNFGGHLTKPDVVGLQAFISYIAEQSASGVKKPELLKALAEYQELADEALSAER